MTRLYRSTRDKMFTGLIGGLSETFGVETTLLRIIFVISIFFTGGTTLLIYLIASLVIPKEPYYHDPYGPGGPGRGQNNYHYGPNGSYGGYNNRPGGTYRDDRDNFGPRNAGPSSYDRGYASRHEEVAPEADLDSMMKDIEKKAMKKEIEELKKKLSKYEKGDL
ncbi:phage shock protein C (PspC) family protein [Paenibacillus uliginis N3/975]|uniref:Phage shock protein C (PspC) family protein n=1 Tax=Paenibacillus uliginis N3/975 TaxID=1313296 RepID=A0A1X7GL54_9BACL|nr:PspC domain-containing protein [Paenibacillus uliginis]SMF71373.1 phage shock protein C (PspC) family protein [Paenibacillus uliginis N3/975]